MPAPMQQQIDWYELHRRFSSIPDPLLRADGQGITGSGKPWRWLIVNAVSPSTKIKFGTTARLAGWLLDPDAHDPITTWLEALRKARLNFLSRLQAAEEDGRDEGLLRFGTISALCEASANFCLMLEAENARGLKSEIPLSCPSPTALVKTDSATLGPIALKSTVRKSFVEPILCKNGWSLLEWANEADVDFHTVDDYLKGKTNPYPSTRKALAEALGVAITDLPE
jgi:lambda repressor-like predicted transcriptional regulator